MKTEQWLAEATTILAKANISTARLDVLVLLEDATGKDRSWLLAHPEEVVSPPLLKKLDEQIKRRSLHEPLAYIRGRSEFYGREFSVTPATLQPRPETETMIDLLKALDLKKDRVAVDIGTGSGAIAITAKLELPHLVVHGTEIQPDALAVAHKNRKKLTADVMLHEGDLLEPLLAPHSPLLTPLQNSIILANLPYVPDAHTINQAAMQEPPVAIFGGEDGLDLYRRMFEQLEQLPAKPAYVLTESLPFQHEALSGIAGSHAYRLFKTEDFIQVFSLAAQPRA